jgi:MFS family permease
MKQEKQRDNPYAANHSKAERMTLATWLKSLPKNLKLFILVSALFALANFGYAFLLLKAKSAWATDERAIRFYVLFYGVYTLVSAPMGMLSDRFGRKAMLWIAYSVFLVVTLWLALVTQIWRVILFFVLFGFLFGIVDGTQRAMVVDLAGKEWKWTALGVFNTAIWIVALPGWFILGMLRDKISPEATFLFAFAIGVLLMILFGFVRTKKDILPAKI